jgi:adenylate kinase family enzyme
VLLSVLLAAKAVAVPPPGPAGKRVVVLVGMPGAGKSTGAGILSAHLSAPRWTSGDIIRATIRDRGLPYDEKTDRQVAEEFARNPGAIGRRVAQGVAQHPSPYAVIEGFRDPRELDAFLQEFPQSRVVALEVGTARRHQRMLLRGRAGENTIAYLRDRDRAETRRGTRAVMRGAQLRIRPRGESLPALQRSLDRVAREVFGRPLKQPGS